MSQVSRGNHDCPRCGFATRNIGDFKRHLQRKKPCEPLRANVDLAETILQYFHDAVDLGASNVYVCPACRKTLRSKSGWYSHKQRCHQRPALPPGAAHKQLDEQEQKEEEDRIAKLERANEELQKQLTQILERTAASTQQQPTSTTTHNNTNCTTTTHNQIQVNVINTFGKERLDHISDPFKKQCIYRTSKGLLELLEKMHFDPSVPENANVRITNRKLPLAEIRTSDRWTFARRDQVLNDLLEKGHTIMQEHFDDHQDEIKSTASETMFAFIADWMEKIADRDKDTVSDLLTDIFVLLLNNSTTTTTTSGTTAPAPMPSY
jgi:hypothetical protein